MRPIYALISTHERLAKPHNPAMLDKLFGFKRGRSTGGQTAVAAPSNVSDEDMPRYPPFQKGFPISPVQRLLDSQRALVNDIRHSLGLEIAEFERLVLPVLERYAAFVHLLPASEKHHHRGAGGLLRHGLEVAFWAARASEGVVFVAGGTPLERKELEPRWHVAVCLAGLLHDVGKPVSDLSIVDRDGTTEWDPYSETLIEWANTHHLDRYFLHWHPKRLRRHQLFSLCAAAIVLTPEIRHWLAQPHREIISSMYETLLTTDAEQPVAQLVKNADAYSVSKDLKDSRHEPGGEWGIPIEGYLMDAMRRLLGNGDWKLNERGARVWATPEGIFVVWKQAAEDIVQLLAQDDMKGIPKDHRSLAKILIERDYAIPFVGRDNASYLYWPVAPDLLRTADGAPVVLSMLRLSGTHHLFNTESPSMTPAQILDQAPTSQMENGVEGGRTVAATTANADHDHINTTADSARRSTKTATKTAPATDNAGPGKTLHIGGPAKQELPQKPAIETVVVPAAAPPASAAPHRASEKYLTDHGEAGKLLLAMAHDIANGKFAWGESLARVGERVVVCYPEGVQPYAESTTALNHLSAAGWLDLDPAAPNRKVRELEGVRGLVLNAAVSVHVLAATQCLTKHEAAPQEKPSTTPKALTTNDDSQEADPEIEELLSIIRSQRTDLPYKTSTLSKDYVAISIDILGWYENNNTYGATIKGLLDKLNKHPGVRVSPVYISVKLR